MKKPHMKPTLASHDGYGRPLVIDGTFPKGRPSCRSAFDDALAASDADGFFAALDSAGLWGGPWAEQVARMSTELRVLRLGDLLQSSIDFPAGIVEEQMFAEHGPELKAWLDEHDAPTPARCVQALLKVFPRGKPITDADRRADYLSSFEQDHPDRLAEIGSRYGGIGEKLAVALRELLKSRGAKLAEECEALRAEFAEAMPLTLDEILQITDDVEFRRALVLWLNAPGSTVNPSPVECCGSSTP
jgi:hypothetical protein